MNSTYTLNYSLAANDVRLLRYALPENEGHLKKSASRQKKTKVACNFAIARARSSWAKTSDE
jgi:hypothetical protein